MLEIVIPPSLLNFQHIVALQALRADLVDYCKSIRAFFQFRVNDRTWDVRQIRIRVWRRKFFGIEAERDIPTSNSINGINRRSLEFPGPAVSERLFSFPNH